MSQPFFICDRPRQKLNSAIGKNRDSGRGKCPIEGSIGQESVAGRKKCPIRGVLSDKIESQEEKKSDSQADWTLGS
jgi:hypothetical protein